MTFAGLMYCDWVMYIARPFPCPKKKKEYIVGTAKLTLNMIAQCKISKTQFEVRRPDFSFQLNPGMISIKYISLDRVH